MLNKDTFSYIRCTIQNFKIKSNQSFIVWLRSFTCSIMRPLIKFKPCIPEGRLDLKCECLEKCWWVLIYTSYFFIEYYQSYPWTCTGELSSLEYVLFIRRARGRSCALMTSEEERSFINVHKSLLTVPYVDRQRGCFYLAEHGAHTLVFVFILFRRQVTGCRIEKIILIGANIWVCRGRNMKCLYGGDNVKWVFKWYHATLHWLCVCAIL